jgi:molybdopterin-containing oxidoreductase family membrane subunit
MSRDLAQRPGVLGTFAHLDTLLDAVREIVASEHEVRDVFTPVPVAELESIIPGKPSKLPLATLLGGFGGMAGGFALGILTALIWNIVVGGKPPANHVPFVVVAFEATILLGALATLAALLFFAKLPFRKFPGPGYRPEFSRDRFGVWVACTRAEMKDVEALLRDVGAVAVEQVDTTGRKGGGR